MDTRGLVLRLGAGMVILALVLRLFSACSLPAGQWLQRPDILSFLIYLQTGRRVHYRPQEMPVTKPTAPGPLPTMPPKPEEEPAIVPVFGRQDMDYIAVNYSCDYRPDMEALLTAPLQWQLKAGEPTVLIIHTHATESYTKAPGEIYEESGNYRTLEHAYNMISIGEEIARILTEGGISVLHDKSFHDYPSYNGSYSSARGSIQAYLNQYPSIRMVLDLHRDAAGDGSTGQLVTSAVVNGEDSAQLMLVAGSDNGSGNFPNWQENLALALKLHAQLTRTHPGLCRPLQLRRQRFNLDMTPGSLLVEVGAAGNTRAQALVAARALAEGILALAQGTLTEDSTM